MIVWLRDWITGLAGAGIITAVTLAITPEGGVKRVSKLACGLVMIIALCRPFLTAGGVSLTLPQWAGVAARQTQAGLEAAYDTQKRFIEERLSAYILSEGEELGLNLEVKVETVDVNGTPMPSRAEITLRGGAPATDVETLTKLIEKECGIPARDQHWRR